MIRGKRKEIRIAMSDISRGVNTSEDSTRIGTRQVQDCRNAYLRKEGIERPPGYASLGSEDFTTYFRGGHVYQQLAGTEYLLAVSDGKLYRVNTTTGAKTELYNMGNTGGEAWFANYLDKCFVANGGTVVKVEGSSAYRDGIVAPSGASASVVAGGTLPDGVYQVYISYARKVSGTNVLFSQGQSLGAVTCGSGNNTVRVADFANSGDTQVNNKVVWMSDAGGSTIYFYHETDDNTTTTVDVDSNTNKSTSITYGALAVNNGTPGAFTAIKAFDGRIWGAISNVVYFSLKNTANSYDLERYPAANTITLPFQLTDGGIFSVGEDLFFNTVGGLYRQPKGDPYVIWQRVNSPLYFKYMRTVCEWNGGVIGLTSHGIRFFDGEKFYDYDISMDVRNEIARALSPDANFLPCGAIYRRSFRTEYHFSYQDTTYSTTTQNRRLILNLDRLEYLPEKRVTAPWEIHTAGANYMAVGSDGTMYNFQSHASTPKVYKENSLNNYHNGIYLENGSLGGADTLPDFYVISRTWLLDIASRNKWEMVRALVQANGDVNITVYMRDIDSTTSAGVVTSSAQNLWDSFNWGENWATESPEPKRAKLPAKRGYQVYFKIQFSANDINFKCLEITLEGKSFMTRFT